MDRHCDPALLARLATHRTLGAVPEAERVWLAEHGTLRVFKTGEVLTPKGGQTTVLYFVLSGNIVMRADRGAGSHKLYEWREGDVGGLMPYSRGASPPADATAEMPTEMLIVSRELFPELTHACPVMTATMVHAMIDRARQFTSSQHQDEKLVSLGKLAAGLAHELNNPASAAVRSAKLLAENVADAEEAARRLGGARPSDQQLAAINEVREACRRAPARVSYSAIARADREDSFTDWLERHGAATGSAATLAETGVTLDQLDALAEKVAGDALDAALQWIAAGCQLRSLASSIETSASRINDLVGAVKGFTFMDHARTPEPVDIRQGIADTFTMLGAKTRAKSVAVSVELPDDLPKVHGVGAELNQVWMNLIDNAVDAVADNGRVDVTAGQVSGRVVVRIVDDGPGIPPEIQDRIFDPFFTTKGVGQGSGLGLDIVRRMVQKHAGEIELVSRPGHTEFQVRLAAESDGQTTPA